MIPLVKLKKEVEFNTDLKHIVDALKGIALSRFHILQRELAIFDRFPALAGNILAGISLDKVDHPFVSPVSKKTSVLMVTTDTGFLGGLNTQVLTTGLKEGGADGLYSVIGERGANYLSDQHRECTVFPAIDDRARGQLAARIRTHLLEQVLRGECGRLIVVFPKPISLGLQKIEAETLLPCKEWLEVGQERLDPGEFIWESRPQDILTYVMTFWIEHRLDAIFAMSRVSELGARVMHLEGSYQELVRQGKKLHHDYFRSRHEVIDRSMREVFASQLLFNSLEAAGDGKPDKDEEASNE